MPLAEYQSQTPESFSDSKPVLHLHLKAAAATIPKAQCGTLAVFPADSPEAPAASTNGHVEPLAEQTVDVFVNSEYVCSGDPFVASPANGAETLPFSAPRSKPASRYRIRLFRFTPSSKSKIRTAPRCPRYGCSWNSPTAGPMTMTSTLSN